MLPIACFQTGFGADILIKFSYTIILIKSNNNKKQILIINKDPGGVLC